MSTVVESRSETLIETSLTRQVLLDNPLLNKGSAFSEDERRELGLLGLLPLHCSTVDEQLARTYETIGEKRAISSATFFSRHCKIETKHSFIDCCRNTSLR
jgi:hypothetical protein